LCCVLACATAPSCKKSGSSRTLPTGAGVNQGVTGTVLFQKPAATTAGLSSDGNFILVPARFVRVDIVQQVGGALQTLVRTTTDGDGNYGVSGTFPAGFQVMVVSTSEDAIAPNPGYYVRVEDNPLGAPKDRSLYGVVSGLQAAGADDALVRVDVVASLAGPDRAAGAFNIIDVMQRGAQLWRDATGIVPNLVTVLWEHGVQPRTSFFDSGTNSITVLGGVAGAENRTDTDEFDDSVLAHEYNHFLTRNHSATTSPGGQHGGEDLVPTLAYDEALANWYSGVARNTSTYIDTIGNAGGNTRCAYCDDLEQSVAQAVTGIGSEQSIMEILWDLVDGSADGPVDVDRDAVALSPDEILAALVSYRDTPDAIHITTLLDELVRRGAISTAALQDLLVSPEDQNLTYPPIERDNPATGRDLFPIPIRRGQSIPGWVDASLPGANVTRGFDSIRTYGLDLQLGGTVRVTLDIQSNGRRPGDLDLFLLTTRNSLIGSSTSETSREVVTSTNLAPGRYIIEVRGYFIDASDVANPNAANYTLRVD